MPTCSCTISLCGNEMLWKTAIHLRCLLQNVMYVPFRIIVEPCCVYQGAFLIAS